MKVVEFETSSVRATNPGRGSLYEAILKLSLVLFWLDKCYRVELTDFQVARLMPRTLQHITQPCPDLTAKVLRAAALEALYFYLDDGPKLILRESSRASEALRLSLVKDGRKLCECLLNLLSINLRPVSHLPSPPRLFLIQLVLDLYDSSLLATLQGPSRVLAYMWERDRNGDAHRRDNGSISALVVRSVTQSPSMMRLYSWVV
ncbi:hypothetical protein FRC00_009871 [Tulasnella sp. 408]|nr:hypothetical protein FRC00_009871 [Tulasnella sp. 408]